MKIIIFFVSVLFIFSTIAISDEKKCEDKKLISKMLCKSSYAKNSVNKFSNIELDKSNIKDKKYIVDWFKKKE